MTITTIDGKKKTITREEAEAAFQKIKGLFHEIMLAEGELFGDSHASSYRFVNTLHRAVIDTRRDMKADGGLLLSAIPVLTMYLLGIEAACVEHPHPHWNGTQRAKRIVYGMDLPSTEAPNPVAADAAVPG